jgi:hypothetical protein
MTPKPPFLLLGQLGAGISPNDRCDEAFLAVADPEVKGFSLIDVVQRYGRDGGRCGSRSWWRHYCSGPGHKGPGKALERISHGFRMLVQTNE